MKKRILGIIAVMAVAAISVVTLVGCSPYVGLTTQAMALQEVYTGRSDVAVIDSIMGNYTIVNNESYKDSLSIIEGIEMPGEEYGIAFNKNSVLEKKVNFALSELGVNGKITEIATKYGLQNETIPVVVEDVPTLTAEELAEWDSYVTDGVVVGVTFFAPIAFKDTEGELIGYDIDLAKAVFAQMGVEVKFQEITWAQKITEMKSGKIDVIWNGMTVTEEIKEALSVSKPYLKNTQMAIVKKENLATFSTTESWKEATIACEKGSAGERFVKTLFN